MSGAAVRPGFALRGEALHEITHAVAAARGLERERRVRRALSIGGGWAVAGMMTVVAGACLAVMWNRPIPQDRIYVSVLHDDGTYDAPIVREDLPRSQREMLFRHTIVEYIKARENYTWEAENANYRRASAMSAPVERDRYQSVMLDRKNPDNPETLYGSGTNAATADVVAVQVQVDPASPNAVAAVFLVKVTPPNQEPRTIRKTARMTWMPAAGLIPAAVQTEYDPAGIAFTHYSSTPDPDAKR